MIFKKILIILILGLLACTTARSMGYSGENQGVTYEPGLETTFSWTIITTSNQIRDYGITVEGDLSEYVTVLPGRIIKDVVPGGNPKVTMILKLPETEPSPGQHTIMIYMSERPTEEERNAGIVALSGVRVKIDVNVLYPGKYLVQSVQVNDLNLGDDIEVKLNLANYGKERITRANTELVIFDEENNKLKEFSAGSVLLNSDEKKEITKRLSSQGLEAGDYKISAITYWDEGEETSSTDFRIGQMDILVINYTKEAIAGKINEFFVDVESKWNGEIKDSYAEIEFYGQTVKTPTYDIPAWGTTRMKTYITIPEDSEGVSEIVITTYYGEKEKEEKGFLIINKSKETLNTTMLIVGAMGMVIALLVGINIMLMTKKRNKDHPRGKK